MLDIARIHGAQLELHNRKQVKLVPLVRRAIENQAEMSHRCITLETDVEEISGIWDEVRLEQVLNNLLGNAIKYSLEGRPVNVRIRHTVHEVIISMS